MFEFNDEYLFKSIMSMINDESDRIVSMGLVSSKTLKDTVEQKLLDIVREAGSNPSQKDVLSGLSGLHSSLGSIRLPGDFEKFGEKEDILRRITKQELEDLTKSSGDESAEGPTCSVCNDQGNMCSACSLSDDGSDEELEKEKEAVAKINSTLEKIVYKFGQEGNHDAAYLVERTMHRINDTIK